MKLSFEFGKYLGFPMLNHKPKPKDFQFVIDQIRIRLSHWKSNFLNIAGRTTLVTSTLSAIPTHLMQYTMLPTKTLNQINKIQGDFIWGITNSGKKIHLVNWKTVTKDKMESGLGIRSVSKKQNLVLLTNLACRLLNSPSDPGHNSLPGNTPTKILLLTPPLFGLLVLKVGRFVTKALCGTLEKTQKSTFGPLDGSITILILEAVSKDRCI